MIQVRIVARSSSAVMSAAKSLARRSGPAGEHPKRLAVAIHVRRRWSVWMTTGHTTGQT